MARIILCTAFLLFLTLSATGASDRQQLHISSDLAGSARVYLRPSGYGRYELVSRELPCTVSVSQRGNLDVKVEKHRFFIIVHRGEKKDISAPSGIMVTTTREILWDRLALIVTAPLLLLVEIGRRRKNRETSRLKSSLELASEEVKSAELKAAKNSLGDSVPEKIGAYTVERKIGEGGMASVYLGKDAQGYQYALKVPHIRYLQDPEFLSRFRHEAKIGQSLTHRNIVKLLDYNLEEEKGLLYIAMEYIDGESLSVMMKKNRMTEREKILDIIIQILEGLGYAHEKNITHRDIKPSNIMLTSGGGVKIMDFGVAKSTELSALTITDMTLGTPMYMAPEQIDSKTADSRCDLYSIGVILYEICTGRPLFEESDPIKLILKKHRENPAPPHELNGDIPPSLSRIILKLLERSPEDRYGSAREAIGDLQKERL